MKLGRFSTKRKAVEAALKLLVQTRKQQKARALCGKLKWEGSLDAVRTDS